MLKTADGLFINAKEAPEALAILKRMFRHACVRFLQGLKIEHKLFFLKLFGQFRDIPAKSRDIPPKMFDFPGFEGHIELFGPHPFTWEDPIPHRKYPDSKVWFFLLFFVPDFKRVFSPI